MSTNSMTDAELGAHLVHVAEEALREHLPLADARDLRRAAGAVVIALEPPLRERGALHVLEAMEHNAPPEWASAIRLLITGLR